MSQLVASSARPAALMSSVTYSCADSTDYAIYEAIELSPLPTLRVSYCSSAAQSARPLHSCRGNTAWTCLFEPSERVRSDMAALGTAPTCVHPDDAEQYAARAAQAMQRRQHLHYSAARFVSGSGAVFNARETAVFEYFNDAADDRGANSRALPLLRSATLSYSHVRHVAGPAFSASVSDADRADDAEATVRTGQRVALPAHVPIVAFDTPVARSASGGITMAPAAMAAFQARLAIDKYQTLHAGNASECNATQPGVLLPNAAVLSTASDHSAASTAPASVSEAAASAPSSSSASAFSLASSSPSSLSVQPSAAPSPRLAAGAGGGESMERNAADAAADSESASLLSPLGQLLRARVLARRSVSLPRVAAMNEPLPAGSVAAFDFDGAASSYGGQVPQAQAGPLALQLAGGPRKLLSPSILAPHRDAAAAPSSSAGGAGVPSRPRAFPPVPRMFAELMEGKPTWAAAASTSSSESAAGSSAGGSASEPIAAGAASSQLLIGDKPGKQFSAESRHGNDVFTGGTDSDADASAGAAAAAGAGWMPLAATHRVAQLAAAAALKASVAASVRLQLPGRDDWQRLADASPFPALLRAADLPVPPPFVMAASSSTAAAGGELALLEHDAHGRAADPFDDLIKGHAVAESDCDVKAASAAAGGSGVDRHDRNSQPAVGVKRSRAQADPLGLSVGPLPARGPLAAYASDAAAMPLAHASKHFASTSGSNGNPTRYEPFELPGTEAESLGAPFSKVFSTEVAGGALLPGFEATDATLTRSGGELPTRLAAGIDGDSQSESCVNFNFPPTFYSSSVSGGGTSTGTAAHWQAAADRAKQARGRPGGLPTDGIKGGLLAGSGCGAGTIPSIRRPWSLLDLDIDV